MAYQIDMDGPTRELVRHLPPERKRAIKEALRAIARNPALGNPLQDELAGLQSYRVGSLRIVHAVRHASRVVHVIAIGPRSTIYEELDKGRRSRTKR